MAQGRYELGEPIGEGAMASVVRARDTQLGVVRAIKILKADYARKKKIRVRFEAEARAMARVEHRHIVRVYDVGLEDRTPYIVMELIEGETLEAIWERAPLPPLQAIDWMDQVCAGVEHAHQHGIIHRDIKPQNVLVDGRGVAKLADFGIAQSDHDERLTKTGSTMGTLGFMSPEQRYDAKTADLRADVFSLGATLWRLVSTAPLTELFMAEEYATLFAGLHPSLTALVMKATAYRPDERYPDVASLRAALAETRRQVEARPDATTDVRTFAERVQQRSAPDDVLPDYIDKASTPAAAPRQLNFGEAFPTAAPAPESASLQTARALARSPTVWAVAVLLVVGVGCTGATTLGARSVDAAAQAATSSRTALFATLESEARLLGTLEAEGVDTTTLRAALGRAHAAKTLGDRAAAGVAYVDETQRVVEPLVAGQVDASMIDVDTRLRRLVAARDAWKRDEQAWRDASSGLTGGLAVALGLADGTLR